MISATITSIPDLVQALNNELRSLREEIAAARQNPVLDDDLDMQGNSIINVGKSRGRNDVPTRSELIEKALYENESGQHVAHSTIVAPEGIRSKVQARENHDLVPFGQLKKLLAAGGGSGDAVLTTNIDQSVRGFKRMSGLALLRKSISVANGNTNHNVDIAASSGADGCFILLRNATANFGITGFRRSASDAGGVHGQLIVLHNQTNFAMTLFDENNATAASSSADNRMRLPGAANIVIRKAGTLALLYNDVISRWVSFSFT